MSKNSFLNSEVCSYTQWGELQQSQAPSIDQLPTFSTNSTLQKTETPQQFGKRIAKESVDKYWHILEKALNQLMSQAPSQPQKVKKPNKNKVRSCSRKKNK